MPTETLVAARPLYAVFGETPPGLGMEKNRGVAEAPLSSAAAGNATAIAIRAGAIAEKANTFNLRI
jgi:hypothetical protein